jgi:hypothetical protein
MTMFLDMSLWVTVRYAHQRENGLWLLSPRGVPVVIVCRGADHHQRGCIITSTYFVRYVRQECVSTAHCRTFLASLL